MHAPLRENAAASNEVYVSASLFLLETTSDEMLEEQDEACGCDMVAE
jgi:hypothetical protein